ncbi:MAG: peptide deformylase [Pseudomonadota bacterium]
MLDTPTLERLIPRSRPGTFHRRAWLGLTGLAGLGLLLDGCAPRVLTPRREDMDLLGIHEGPLPIVQWLVDHPDPDSVLRQVAGDAARLRRWYLAGLDDAMRKTLKESGGVGLAAPQVGVSSRVILVQRQDGSEDVLTCVDPRIIGRSDDTVEGWEACLSIEGVGGKVARAREIRVGYRDLQGGAHALVSRDFEARIFQHEFDHLDGILYVDKLLGPLLPIEEMRRRREEEKAAATRQGD